MSHLNLDTPFIHVFLFSKDILQVRSKIRTVRRQEKGKMDMYLLRLLILLSGLDNMQCVFYSIYKLEQRSDYFGSLTAR